MLTNCVLFGNGSSAIVTNSPAVVTASYSLFEAGVTGFTDSGNNVTGVTTLPFATTATTQLSPCSPAINVGSNAANSSSTDLAGLTRIVSTTIDMGAYEYQGNPFNVSISATPSLTITAGQSATLTASGANSYTWNMGETTTSIVVSPTSTTAYSVTGTTGGCTAVSSATVTVNAAPPVITMQPVAPGMVCLGGSVTIPVNVTGATSFQWLKKTTPNDPNVAVSGQTSATLTLTNLQASDTGIYSLSVSGPGGSTVSNGVSIQPVAPPVAFIVANPSLTITQGQSTTLTASGAQSLLWSTGETSPAISVSVAGPYSVTVSASGSGCFASKTVTVTVLANPSINVGPVSGTITACAGTASISPAVESFTVSGANLTGKLVATVPTNFEISTTNNTGYGISVTLVPSGGTVAPTMLYVRSSASATGLISGYVSLTSTGASSQIVAVDGTVNPLPTATLTPSSATLTCANPSVTLTAGGGSSYTFSTGATQIGSTNQAVVTTAGTYTVTVSNANACVATATAQVFSNTVVPTVSISPSSAILTCASPSVSLTAVGSGTVRWDDNSTNSVRSVSSSGTYSVTLTNSNGCVATASVVISQDQTAPSVSISPSSATLTCASPSVSLTAVGSGSVVWNDGSTNPIRSVSASGIYSVTLTSGSGCMATASVVISQDRSMPQVSISASPSLTINQGQSTTLTAQVSGGTAPFGFTWSTNESTSVIVVSTPGPYSLTATGANGCSANSSVTVTVNPVVSGPFAITGVTTVSCTPILPNRFSVSFSPQYQGLNGQPVSFSVTNELLPTPAHGPYTLQLYTDNPSITLEARQGGGTTRFVYYWLAACNNTTAPNTPPRVVSPIPSQTATVGQYLSYVIPEGTFTDDQTPTSLRLSATGLPPGLGFSVATLSGTPSTTVGSSYSITITATDPGNLTVSTVLVLTVLPGGSTPPPPTDVFSITGVTTISCTPVANRISLSFAPRYAGLNGQPIAFEVVNESLPTTEPGPYSLTLYRDNSVITLRANQTGSTGPVTFAYHWLDACGTLGQANTPPRVNEPVGPQSGTVGVGYSLNLGNTFTDQETPNQISLSAAGLPAGLALTGKFISGTPSLSGVSSVTLTATDGGGLSTSISFSFTVSPGAVMPPPTGIFSITGVTTVSCEVISAGQRRVTFSPLYAGLDGSPVSFRVVNEMVATTNPGPYRLNLYTDNPVITLSAVQSGVSSQFSYGWLSACTPGSRVGSAPEVPLQVTVLGNPATGSHLRVDVRGAEGQPLHLQLTNASGALVNEQRVERGATVERQTLEVGPQSAGILLLRVSTPTQTRIVKVVKGE
jgi:hypothetical protein